MSERISKQATEQVRATLLSYPLAHPALSTRSDPSVGAVSAAPSSLHTRDIAAPSPSVQAVPLAKLPPLSSST